MKGRGKMPGGAPIFMRYFKYFAVRNFFLKEKLVFLSSVNSIFQMIRNLHYSKVNSKD